MSELEPVWTLNQLAQAFTLEKAAKMIQIKASREAPRSAEFERGVQLAISEIMLLSQCFAPGHAEHPFRAAWTETAVIMQTFEEPQMRNRAGLRERIVEEIALLGAKSFSAREIATRTNRNVSSVHSMIHLLRVEGKLLRLKKGFYKSVQPEKEASNGKD